MGTTDSTDDTTDDTTDGTRETTRPLRSTPALVFLGRAEAPAAPPAPLRCEGRVLEPGDVLPLARTRSPWNPRRAVERVIAGSDPRRADLRLEGEGIHPEHLRLYIHTAGGDAGRDPTDLRAMHPDSTRLDGAAVEALRFMPLRGGEEVEIAGWRFRYEHGDRGRGAEV